MLFLVLGIVRVSNTCVISTPVLLMLQASYLPVYDFVWNYTVAFFLLSYILAVIPPPQPMALAPPTSVAPPPVKDSRPRYGHHILEKCKQPSAHLWLLSNLVICHRYDWFQTDVSVHLVVYAKRKVIPQRRHTQLEKTCKTSFSKLTRPYLVKPVLLQILTYIYIC